MYLDGIMFDVIFKERRCYRGTNLLELASVLKKERLLLLDKERSKSYTIDLRERRNVAV